MGNVTAKTSGEIASFMTPAKTNIKSLKVHFSPKQLGTGDPSPENVREIVGWDGVEVAKSSVNLLDQSYITEASGWILSSDDGNTIYCGVPVYKGIISKFYTKFKNSYPFIGNPFKENIQYNISVWLKTVSGDSLQGLKFGFRYTDGTSSLGGIFSANNIWKRQTVTSKANKTVSGIYCTYNNSGEIYLCGLAVCEKEFDDINTVHSSTVNDISHQWKLPDEYQEVEYIESTGTQYIITDIPVQQPINVSIDTMIGDSGSDMALFTTGYESSPQNVRIGVGWYNGKIQNYYQRYYTLGDANSMSRGVKHHAEIYLSQGLQTAVLNGTQLPNTNYTLNDTLLPINGDMINFYIFAEGRVRSSGKIDTLWYSKARIYALKVDDADSTIGNFVPCYRKSDNEIGMYDTVSQTFYTNQGTGTFLKGNDIDKTFYGGYIDLISGELVETHSIITFDGSDDELITHSSNFNDWVQLSGISNMKKGSFFSDNSSVSNRAKKVFSSSNKNELQILIGANNTKTYIYNIARLDSTVTTDEILRNWFSNNPITFTYPLETPITHQLTPTQLQSFIGQNNFWSNADYVEIEYDLIETIDIQKARQKIILNQPHTESVIGDVANFTTNMKAPLKECKVYFSPIQEGSGDPSPDNVRNIVGWDEVETYKNGKNIAHIVGYSAKNGELNAPRYTSNSYGTTINTTDFLLPDTKLIVTQSSYTTEYDSVSYRNGYFVIFVDNLDFEKKYNVSFNVDIINNPLNVDISRIRVLSPLGTGFQPPTMINGNRLFYTNVPFTPYSNGGIQNLNRKNFEIRNCGMSFTLSEFMVTPVEEEDFAYEPYCGDIISTSWTDEIGTIYGGYVDLAKGELVAEWEMAQGKWGDIKSSTAVSPTGYYTGKFNYSNTIKISHYQSSYYKNSICNITNTILWQTGEKTPEHFYCGNNSNTNKGEVYIFGNYNDDTTIQIIVKLAEPIHYSLSPQQLLTFKGENNIWSDTNGQTEVKFWTH